MLELNQYYMYLWDFCILELKKSLELEVPSKKFLHYPPKNALDSDFAHFLGDGVKEKNLLEKKSFLVKYSELDMDRIYQNWADDKQSKARNSEK